MTDFDSVWPQIVQCLRSRERVETLSQRVPNRIVAATEDAVTVQSQQGGGPRLIPRQDFNYAWDKLARQGTLTLADLEPELRGHKAIILAIFAACAPGVQQVPGRSAITLRVEKDGPPPPRPGTGLRPGVLICRGRYRIEGLLGEGGQSRVWLAREVARDLRVAIKEPLPALSSVEQEELAQRFQREMRLSGRCIEENVPHTVRVLTVEEHEGITLLVMEYAAGGNLAQRLAKGPLPVDDGVRVALEVLESLAALHGRLRIVHRDIKPSNVLFAADGQALLGDLGLAQTGESGRSTFTADAHPGTPGYMSPEQEDSRGYLTPRSDLYSLGCVLFEMLTGQRYRDCRPGTPPSSLRPEVPGWLDQVLARALQPDPWDRFGSAQEMAGALREGADGEKRREEEATRSAQAEAEARARREAAEQERAAAEQRQKAEREAEAAQELARRGAQEAAQREAQRRSAEEETRRREEQRRRERVTEAEGSGGTRGGLPSWLWLLGGAVGLALLFGVVLPGIIPPAPTPTPLPRPTQVPPTAVSGAAVPATQAPSQPQAGATRTANGGLLVYVPGGTLGMGSEANEVNADSNEKPRHSVVLDAFWIGQTEVTNEQYGRFMADTGHSAPGYWRDSRFSEPQQPVVGVTWSDAKAYADWAGLRLPTEAEWEYAARGGPKTEVHTYAGSNDLDTVGWYSSNSRSSPSQVAQKVANELGLYDMSGNVWEWCFDWSDERYYDRSPAQSPAGPASGDYRVIRGGSWNNNWWHLRVANRERYDPTKGDYSVGFRVVGSSSLPLVSPLEVAPAPTVGDLGKIAFTSGRTGNLDIFVMNADGSNVRNLTTNPADDEDPAWSPDGQLIAFDSNREGSWQIYVMNVDGTGVRKLTSGSVPSRNPDWSPNGGSIAFDSVAGRQAYVSVVDVDGGDLRRLTNNAADDWDPSWSPTGDSIAFASNRDDPDATGCDLCRDEIYVMNVDGSGQRRLTTDGLDSSRPAWSPDSHRIAFYVSRGPSPGVYVISVDGTDRRMISGAGTARDRVSWSPAGTLVAFESLVSGRWGIHTAQMDGSGFTALNTDDSWGPAWSPE